MADKQGYQHYIPEVPEDPTWRSKIKTHLVSSLEELQSILDEHKSSKYIAWDTEATGLNADTDRLVGYSIAYSGIEGWYIPIRHLVGKNLDAKQSLLLLYNELSSKEMVFEYNMRFDSRMMEKEGFDMSKVHYYDVQVGVYLADTNWKRTGLKGAERRWLGWTADTFEETLGSEQNFAYIDPEVGYDYACLTGDMEVQTERGLVPIRFLTEDDRVLTSRGYNRVLSLYDQGVKETVRVTSKLKEFRCTPNHRVAVESVLGPVFIEVSQLSRYSKFYTGSEDIREELKENVHNKTGREVKSQSFPCQTIQDFELCYYMLGYGLADGCLIGNRLSFHIQKQDRQILEDINERIGSKATIRKHISKSPTNPDRELENIECSYSSEILREFLVNHGFEENKTGHEHYSNIPDEYYRDFLRGFYDGDGSSNGYNMCFVCCENMSQQISEDLKRILNIEPLQWYKKGENLGDLTYGRRESVKLYRYLYGNSSISLIRKRDKALKKKEGFISLIDKDGNETIWCNISEAAKFAGVEVSSLSAVKNGKRNHTRGWRCKAIMQIEVEPYVREFDNVEINKEKSEQVYDIMVENVHNYRMANGIISHNCVDALGTFAVCQKTIQFYKEAGIAGRIINESLYPFMKCEDHKIRMSLSYLRQCEEETLIHLKDLEHEIIATVGYPFKLNSNKQLGEALQSLGINTGAFTKGGQMKVDIASLETTNLREPNEILEKLIDYSKSFKMYNSYISTLIGECEENDSLLRFNYKHCASPTGRVAAGSDGKNDYFAKINVMAIPKPHPKEWYVHSYKEGDSVPEGDVVILNWRFSLTDKSEYMTEGQDPHLNMRCAFRPDEGHYLVGMDYSAQELRMQANLANVKVWVDTFNSGGDLHKNMALAMWGEQNYDKEKRKKAKVLNFGMLYGMSGYTLAERFHVPLEEAQDIESRYWKAVPEIQAYQRAMLRKAKKEGVTYNYFHLPRRVKHYLNSDDSKMRAFGQRTVGNNPIQSSCASMTQLSFIQVYQKLYSAPEWKDKCHFFAFIHDEIVSSVKKEDVLEFINIQKQCMTKKFNNMPVVFETSVALGTDDYGWGCMFEFKYKDDGTVEPDMYKVE